MRRREFIALLGGVAAAWPLAARGQQPMRQVGVLMGGAAGDPSQLANIAGLKKGLAAAGWTEERDIRLHFRFTAGDAGRIQAVAKELVAMKPDVLLGDSTAGARGLARENGTIPIVFTMVADPIGIGLVESMPRPGRNITGFTNFEPAMSGKWLELLKEVAPGIERVVLIFRPDSAPFSREYVASFQTAAKALGVVAVSGSIQTIEELDGIVSTLAREPNSGLVALPDVFTYVNRKRIIALANQHRLPAVYYQHAFTADGGLMTYGVDVPDIFRRAASYLDRILRGEKSPDLPVQAPTKFELVINLNTAAAIGISVPSTLLSRADEVIE